MATIILENKAQVDLAQDFLSRVKNEANLPRGRVLLIFHDGPLLNGAALSGCIPKSLLNYARNERVLNPFIKRRWDCSIVISQKACLLKERYPAYFTYLLGHEFGHAYVCLSDVSLHIHYCLIQEFIREASGNKITQWHELPHEVCFDQFGIYIAEHLFSREKLNMEITQMLKMPNCKARMRLEAMLSLPVSNDFADLRNSLINFSRPYKDKLIELWKKDAIETGDDSLAKLIVNYDDLFK